VEATELDRRQDLVGKLVKVDDRVRFYQFHPGQGYDEVRLKRTNVVFRLPPALRPENSPRPLPVIIQGLLGRDRGELVCDVTSIAIQANDLDRLDRAIADLPAKDFAGRKKWAAWAEKRGKSFKPEDKPLIQRARTIQAEALRLEGEARRVGVDAPGEWLALAEEGRRRNIPEPDPSALAHKAFQAKLAATSKSDAIASLISAIEKFFPQASKDRASGSVELGRWQQAYTNDPAGAYRGTTANLRLALDRRLWADAVQRSLEMQAAEDPARALALSQRAEEELPERPQLATDLLNRGLEVARQNLGALRLPQVKSIAETYRNKLQNPQAALELYRDWLKSQRERLSDTDAEGPVSLAGLYEELLQDRLTAKELLDRAWKNDPGSKEVAEAFRVRGYRKVKDDWVEAIPGRGAEDQSGKGKDEAERARALTEPSHSLRGKVPEEVILQLGSKPDRKTFSASKGQLIEQWIFVADTRRLRFVNFLHTPGDLKPRVVADYFVPRSLVKWELKPAH
jgi:tetratricopeptide (TPR) repeat protein